MPALCDLATGHQKQAASKQSKLLDEQSPDGCLFVVVLLPLTVWIREDRSVNGNQYKRHYRPSTLPIHHETASANVEAGKNLLEVVEERCSHIKLG